MPHPLSHKYPIPISQLCLVNTDVPAGVGAPPLDNYVDELSEGVPSPLRIHSPGNNIRNTYFMWKIPDDISESELLQENSKVIEQVKSQINVLP